MTENRASRTARGCACDDPGHVERPRFVRAVTDGRDTYRYVFALSGSLFIVLKKNEIKGYSSVKIWQTSNMERTYDTWTTKIPVEPEDWMVVDAWNEIIGALYAAWIQAAGLAKFDPPLRSDDLD